MIEVPSYAAQLLGAKADRIRAPRLLASYSACALGHKACWEGFSVLYRRAPRRPTPARIRPPNPIGERLDRIESAANPWCDHKGFNSRARSENGQSPDERFREDRKSFKAHAMRAHLNTIATPEAARWFPLTARIAVLIPCYNEEVAVVSVVRGFRAALPEATVYVYDNNSSDRTADLAASAGAVVRTEMLRGKGYVIRRMFADIEADAYVLVDGDATYDPAFAPAMISLLLDQRLDMVSGTRVNAAEAAYRPGHRWGNQVLTGLVGAIFGKRVTDMLSGYRVFSRRFVKSFPALSSGFETETEFTVHALELSMPIGEVETPYRERPAGSVSKLNTWTDGFRILRSIVQLVKEERPLQFFSIAGAALVVLAIALAVPIVGDYMRTGLVPRFPTAILATGLVLLGFLAFTCGLILDSVARGRKELKRLAYLSVPVSNAGAVVKWTPEMGPGA
jgi:hypothetical protein